MVHSLTIYMLVHHLPVHLENTTDFARYPMKIKKKKITNT